MVLAVWRTDRVSKITSWQPSRRRLAAVTLFVRMRRAGFVPACIFGIRDLIAIFVGHRAAWTRAGSGQTRQLEQTPIHRIEHAVFVAVHGRNGPVDPIWRCALRSDGH